MQFDFRLTLRLTSKASQYTWEELGHSVAACARDTGHDCSRTNPVASRFTDKLESFKPNRRLDPVGHGCARTSEAAVTVVPGYGHDCARTTITRNHNRVSIMFVPMLPK